MTIDERVSNYLPLGWHLSNLIFLDPEWQANISDGEHVAVATGDTIDMALHNATYNAINYIFVGRLAWLDRIYHEPTKPKLTLAGLGLARAAPITRRL